MPGKVDMPNRRGKRWERTRLRVIARAGGQCEGCGKRPGEHVHHLQYWPIIVNPNGTKWKRYGGEPLEWLQYLCLMCHKEAHPRNAPPPDTDWTFRDKLLAQFARR